MKYCHPNESTYKHGTVRRNIRIGIVYVVDASVVHHAGGEVAIDLLVGKVDGIGEHDIRGVCPYTSARRGR